MQDRSEENSVVERFIAHLQETGLISPQLDSRALAIACYSLASGLIVNVMMGMDKDEAKAIWIATLDQLIGVV